MHKKWDGIISQHINRKFSRPIAAFLAKKTRITPNQMSFVSFLVGVLSGVCFFLRQGIIGGILAQVCSILDGVDGDLAVLTGKVSRFGGFFDSLLDRYADSAIILGLTFNAFYSNWSLSLVLAVGLAALFGSLMISYSRARAEAGLGLVYRSGFSGYAANRDVRLFLIMIGGILNQAFVTLIVLAVLTNVTVIKRVLDAKEYSDKS
ncbi:CDP-alcohol phosphatidyltransferase family protein [Candidatus Bathyarchaeota archaeon]|nr:CDP-alcohol phosphatidyltransferase family protein [Candidatus Bathyarchaeota archaeon]